MEEKAPKRRRRRKAEIEKALFDAMELLIKKDGFTGKSHSYHFQIIRLSLYI